MDEVYVLKQKIQDLEIMLSDSNKKLNLNKQYSSTLEDKISDLNNKKVSNNYFGFYIIIFVLLAFVIILYKKNLVLSNSNKRVLKCDKFNERW